MDSIGRFLKAKRLEQNLSLKEAGALTGLTDTKIQRIENDVVREVSPSAIKKLCSLYKIPVVPIYLELGWISENDLGDKDSYFFKGANRLNEEERQFIQSQILFLLDHRRAKK